MFADAVSALLHGHRSSSTPEPRPRPARPVGSRKNLAQMSVDLAMFRK